MIRAFTAADPSLTVRTKRSAAEPEGAMYTVRTKRSAAEPEGAMYTVRTKRSAAQPEGAMVKCRPLRHLPGCDLRVRDADPRRLRRVQEVRRTQVLEARVVGVVLVVAGGERSGATVERADGSAEFLRD